MRGFGLLILLALVGAGCHSCVVGVAPRAEPRATAAAAPCAATLLAPCGLADLATLWNLALANNPALRETAAEVEEARGRLIQAGKYPNPRVAYSEETLGNKESPPGTVAVHLTQEVVTAGKRRLDRAIAVRGTDVASLALVGKKFEVLTRVRRAYYNFVGWQFTLQVQQEVVAALEQGVEITRKQVEVVKSRPRTDLLRLQALMKEAKIEQIRAQVNLETAWRLLAAELGLPQLPLPEVVRDLTEAVPQWDADAVVRRVLAVHTDVKQAAVETERARLEVRRAQAEAVPNVTVGGGYSHEFVDRVQGAVVSVETALPLWDRKQGRVHEARARWTRAQAAERSAANRLSRDAAEAFGRYEAARQQVQKLAAEVLPTLAENLALVRKGYQSGAAQITFADVLLAEQGVNETRLKIAEARRALWLAVADLKGLMQFGLDEELCPQD